MSFTKFFHAAIFFARLQVLLLIAPPASAADGLRGAKSSADSLQPTPTSTSDDEAAQYYAPILWFADAEKYYPTIPFFTTFQWRQRAAAQPDADYSRLLSPECSRDHGIDILNGQKAGAFFDPEMIWPNRSWRGLVETYDQQFNLKPKPQVYVFWDKTSMSAKQFQNFIDSDRQLWKREKNFIENLGSMTKDAERIEVFRYWLYYLNDAGLKGHPQDIESIYVFVRSAQNARAPLPKPLAIIGAGHSRIVPNNVLVATAGNHLDSLFILVELGGHSSAPDRNGDGLFNPGFDANWQAAKLWGTRDTQAAAGLGALGNYEAWMTFPRHRENRCLPPRLAQETAAPMSNRPPDFSFPDSLRDKIRSTQIWSYQLFALNDLQAVYEKIRQLPPTPTISDVETRAWWQNCAKSFSKTAGKRAAILSDAQVRQKIYTDLWQEFGASLEKIGGPPAAAWTVINDSVRQQISPRLQRWLEDQWTYEWNAKQGADVKKQPSELERHRHQPWEHSDYKTGPQVAFKRHLFPPRGKSFLGLADHLFRGVFMKIVSREEYSAGSELLVTDLYGVRDLLQLPGVIVLDASYTKRAGLKPQLNGRIFYDTGYAAIFSGYFGWGSQATWKKPRDWQFYNGFYDTQKFFYAGLKVETYLRWMPLNFDFLQFRAGLRLPHRGLRLLLDQETRLELQMGLHR